jgi:hypothetical protein
MSSRRIPDDLEYKEPNDTARGHVLTLFQSGIGFIWGFWGGVAIRRGGIAETDIA